MPPEKQSDNRLIHGVMLDNRFVEIGSIEEVEFSESDIESIDITPLDFHEPVSITVRIEKIKYTRHTLKWFRKNLGIDLEIIRFPKKKRRRHKRLKRRNDR